MVRVKKIAIRLVLSIVALLLLSTLLVQIPSIQSSLVNYSAKTLTKELGLSVGVYEVELKPLRGSIRLNGINCSNPDGDINLSCQELDLNGIEALLKNQKAGNLSLNDVNLKASSHERLMEFLNNLPKSTESSSNQIELNRLQINNLSINIADTLVSNCDVLIAENIFQNDTSLTIEGFNANNLSSNIYNTLPISTLKGSLQYSQENNLEIEIDTLTHPHAQLSGRVNYAKELECELYISASPDSIFTDLGTPIGNIEGLISYRDSTLFASNLKSTEGLELNTASYELKNNEWSIDGIIKRFNLEIEVNARGDLSSAVASIKEATKGQAEVQADWEDESWSCSIYSEALYHNGIRVSNSKTEASGDFSFEIIDFTIDSREFRCKASAITDLEKWTSFVNTWHADEFMSTGSFTLNNEEFVIQTFNVPAIVSKGSEIHWDINGIENTAQGTSAEVQYEGTAIQGVFVDLLNLDGDTWGNLSGERLLMNRDAKRALIATEISADLHVDSVWAIDSYWKNTSEKTGTVRLEGLVNDGDYDFKIYEATLPIMEDTLILSEAPASLVINDNEIISEEMTWTGGGFRAQLGGSLGDSTLLSFALTTQSIDTARSKKWFNIPFETDSISIVGSIAGNLKSPQIFTTFRSDSVVYKGQVLPRTMMLVTHVDSETKVTGDIDGLGDREGSVGFIGKLLDGGIELKTSALHLPLEYLNPFLPKKTVHLHGYMGGSFILDGTIESPQIKGNGAFEDVTVDVDYLGTEYGVNGKFRILPDGIELNAIDVLDEESNEAILVGTILHNNFSDWNLDITLMLEDKPMKIMDIPYSPEKYFYGTGYGTGHINVFGYHNQINIEANLTTHDGTEFELPMEVASDSDWSSFVSIKSNDEAPKREELYKNNKVRLDLNLDVLESSNARIVFDEAVGDEIEGKCKGHIHVGIDDFERLEMFGDLEIVEGNYLFTLGKVFNKRFIARPGGRISWFGDPYEADIDIETVYTTSASIQPILPETASNNKQKVEVELSLDGELLKPGIVFDINLPESSGEAQAALASMISNEEERNRQAMSLLVLHQFIPGSWQSAAIGSTGLQENSSELITSQLGNWLSGMSEDVNIGINYDSATDTGDEAAIAVALSTQILNDRLHIEGEVGTNNLYTGTMDDLQLQDVRIKYDLNQTGNLQLTGYTTQRTDIPGFEGESVQGVGLLYHKDFDKLIDFFRRNR